MELPEDLIASLITCEQGCFYAWDRTEYTITMSNMLNRDSDKYLYLLSLGIHANAILRIIIRYPGSKISVEIK